MAEIRAGGYAIDDEELSEGVRRLAAPIYNHRRGKNCIGISGPSLRICLDNIDFYIDKIKAAADSISYSIGIATPGKERKGANIMRKAFICPTKYVQGEDELLNLGYFVRTFGESALLIAHKDDVARVREKLDATAEKFDIEFVESNFVGECSRQEIERLKKVAAENKCDCTIGLGGGKAIDTAKCVAQGEALIIVPTIAATDAPTSHSAVMYTPDGAFDDYAYFKQSPSVVLIDTRIIANAPVRFLISGMGDALSTYFEARATAEAYANVNAGLPCGFREGHGAPAKSTKAAMALAALCYDTLMEDGSRQSKHARASGSPCFENIIEPRILHSGLGLKAAGWQRPMPSMTG